MEASSLGPLLKDLKCDPDGEPFYANFDHKEWGETEIEKMPGSSPAPYFYKYISERIYALSQLQVVDSEGGEKSLSVKPRPVLGIEVGSWLGYSAIHFAQHLKSIHPDSKLICIDTWLGNPSHFFRESDFHNIGLKFGFPTLYYRFLSNVMHHNVQDTIVPLPLPSNLAFIILDRLFNKHEIYPDFAFVDGSHEEEDVFSDAGQYYKLLKRPALLCGDDWAITPVSNGVLRFNESHEELKAPINKLKLNDISEPLSNGINLFPNNVHWIIPKFNQPATP